jgi:hypothetical protein
MASAAHLTSSNDPLSTPTSLQPAANTGRQLHFPSFIFSVLIVTLHAFLFRIKLQSRTDFARLRTNVSGECRNVLTRSISYDTNGVISPRDTFLAALGPLAEFVDVARAPLLWRGAHAGSQGSRHDGEGDFSSFLYAEGDWLFFFDQAGPVCSGRHYYVMSDANMFAGAALGIGPAVYDSDLVRLRIEVDGNVVFESALGEMFDGTSIPLTSPALLFSDGTPDCGRSRYGPTCARTRLRMAWSFTPMMELSAVAILRHTDTCISENTVCLVRNYNDVTFISALALPPHWRGTSNYLSGDAVKCAVHIAPTPILTADDAAEAKALNAVSINHCPVSTAERIRRNADPRWVLAKPAAPTAAETSFVNAALNPHALMNRLAAQADQVRAVKRCSTLTGEGDSHQVFVARGESGVLTGWRLSFPGTASRAAGVNAPDLSFVGIWDGGDKVGGANFTSPLSLLFGPPARALAEDWDIKPATNQPLAQLYFGSTTLNTSYWALPAPFRVSARVVVQLTSNRTLPLEVCSEAFFVAGGDSGNAMKGNFFAGADAPVGYLRSVVYDFLLVKGTNVIADIVGVEGKLVAVTSFMGMRHGHTSAIHDLPSTAVEGDWLTFVDGSPAPSTWNTGYEDFFDSAHKFLNRFVAASRPFTGHQRFSFAQGDRYYHPEADLFAVRLLTLDAVPFRYSLRVLIEGWIDGDFSASILMQGTLVFYGRTASVPPVVSDTVYAAVELDSPAAVPSGRPHAFAIEGDAAALVRRYRLSSAVAGASLSLNALPQNPSWQPPPGTPPPPTPLNTTFALDVLAIGHGALISFTIALAPDAQSVMLRRLVDLRYGVQRAVLYVDGERVALLQSSDRAFTHIEAHWTSADTLLPPSVTKGKTSLRVTLEVMNDANENRTYPRAMLGEAWTEAKWEAVCFFD